MHTPNKIINWP